MKKKKLWRHFNSLTRFTKQLVQICSRFNTTFIGINQLRDKINSPMGGKDTTGGRMET